MKSAQCAAIAMILALNGCSPVGSPSAALAAKPAQAATEGPTWYVSLTAKNAVALFHNRLANSRHQLVTTTTPVDRPVQTVALTPRQGERYVLVELHTQSDAPRRGEVARLANFAVISVPLGQDAHAWLGDHMDYTEEFRATTSEAPATIAAPFAGTMSDLPAPAFLAEIQVSQDYLQTKLGEFAGGKATKIGDRVLTLSERRSETGRADARAWLRQQYESLGFTVTEQKYGSGFNSGVNFVAERPGTEAGRFFLISSHIDSVGNMGADDNAAGTISALAIAQALKSRPLRYGLRVIAFDQEENGLVGSSAYVRALETSRRLSEVVAMINLEMTGYDSDDDGAFHSIDCGENTSATLTAAVKRVLAADDLGLRTVDACTNRSDHAAFWKRNKPAIVISENFFGGDDNPCYHKACDKIDKINFKYMTNLTTAIARTAALLTAAP